MTGPIVVVRRAPKPRRNPTHWLVGILAMIGALFEAGDALIMGSLAGMFWWTLGALAMFFLARQVEAFKRGGAT